MVAVLVVAAVVVVVGCRRCNCLAADEAGPGQCLAVRHNCFVVCYSPDSV